MYSFICNFTFECIQQYQQAFLKSFLLQYRFFKYNFIIKTSFVTYVPTHELSQPRKGSLPRRGLSRRTCRMSHRTWSRRGRSLRTT